MHSRRRGLLLPMLAWGVVTCLVLGWQFHRKQAAKATLSFFAEVEGRPELIINGTVNGRLYRSGDPCGVGWKKLVIPAEDAEQFETNIFVWYRGESFGEITLARSRGLLKLDLSPAVESVRVTGSETNKTLTRVTREPLSLPTGRYSVWAKFPHFSVEQSVEIARNEVTPLAIAPSLTALDLRSAPAEAAFELNSKRPPKVSVRGSTPAVISSLPVGEYELRMARGDYRKTLPVSLKGANTTNALNVEFRYARLSVTSEPPEAAISDGRNVIGRTPAQLDLSPGSHSLQIGKDGYFTTNFNLTLTETDVRTISVALLNVSFVEALERARRHSFGRVNNDRALADLEEALRLKPGDETALALKREIQFGQHMRKAWLLERKGAFADALSEVNAALKLNESDTDALTLRRDLEKAKAGADEQRVRTELATAEARAEARRTRPQRVLKEVSSGLRFHELFDEEVVRFKGSVGQVHTGLLQALRNEPPWTVLRDEKLDDDVRVVIAEMTTTLRKYRVAVVAGQTTDEDVLIWFKQIVMFGFKGISDEAYRPRVGMNEGGSVSRELQRDLQTFKKRIEEEVSKHAKPN